MNTQLHESRRQDSAYERPAMPDWLMFLITLALILLSNTSRAQSVGFNNGVPSELTICGDPGTFTIEFTNISGGTLSGMTINVAMPTGIQYISGTIAETSSFNVQEANISDLSDIQFSMNDLPASGTVSFTFQAEASFPALAYNLAGNLFRNDVEVDYSGGLDIDETDSYNVLYAALTITNVSPTNASVFVGETFTREVTIVNAGFGALSSMVLEDIYDANLTLDAVDLGTLNGSADQITFSSADFTTIGDGDGWFEKNEAITVTQTLTAVGCNSTESTLTAYWGCDGGTESSNKKYPDTDVTLYAPSLSITPQANFNTCVDGSADVQSLVITNNGSGPANDLEVYVYQNPSDVYSRIDTDNITLTQTSWTSTLTPTATTSASSYTCLGSNPKGSFTVTLPALQPGETATLSWNSYTCATDACGDFNLIGWKYETDYTDMCYQKSYDKNGTGQERQDKDFDIFFESPSDLTDGQTGTYHFLLQNADFDLPETSDSYFKLQFDLPAGLPWSGNAADLVFTDGGSSWAAEQINYNTSTRVLTALYALPVPITLERAYIDLNLTLDCNDTGVADGVATVGMQLFYIMDNTCSSPYELPLTCYQSPTTYLHCPGDCEHGMAFRSFTAQRTSTGLPDNNQDGLPDASGSLDTDKIKLNRIMASDTFRTTFTGLIKTSATYPSWSYGYAKSEIPNGNDLTFLSASVRIYDQSTGQTFVCSGVSASTSVSSNVLTADFDFSPGTLLANGCSDFSDWSFEEGDSVILMADYQLSGNIGGNVEQQTITNDFYVSNTANGTAFQCDTWNGNITMVGYFFRNRNSQQYNVNDCTKTIAQNFFLSVGKCCNNYHGGDMFPYEYRNWATVQDLRVEIPDGYTYVSATMEQKRTKRTNSSVTESTSITPLSINGQTVIFDLSQYYTSNGGTINPSDDGFKGTVKVIVDPACDVNPVANLPMPWYYTFLESSVLGGQETDEYTTTADYLRYQPASLEVSTADQMQEGISPTVSWPISVSNTSGTPADNGWLNFYSADNSITVLSLVNSSGDTIHPVDGFYQIGDIAGNGSADYTLTVDYDNCNNSVISVRSGYSCDGYPTDLGSFTCGYNTYDLEIAPQESELQVRINYLESGQECENILGVELELLSAKIGAVKNIELDAVMPGTQTITIQAGSAEVLYPESGSYSVIADPSLVGDTYTITGTDMNTTIGQDGLIGITDVTANLLKVKFNLVLDENFKAGEFVYFNLRSDRACGDALPSISVAFDPSAVFGRVYNIGLDASVDSRGISWGDYDNDGWVDAFVTVYNENQPNRLYHNDGDGTFTQVNTGAIATDVGISTAASWGDYDNDGDLDLFVANNIEQDNFLYRNNGDGTFVRVMGDPVTTDQGYTHGVAFIDYDNDGYLDLFTAQYFSTEFNKLYHNNGDGTFTEVSGNAVVGEASFSVSGAWGDYNGDGLADLFVANTEGNHNSLYRNEGNGEFTEITTGDIVSDGGNSVGASWGDYDNDGDLDLFVANSGNQNNFLYRNDGNDNFTRITSGVVVSDGGHSHGSSWADYDNDGDLDLFVTNNQNQNNFLYSNQGDGSFVRVSNALSQDGGESKGAAWADIDNDGDLDLYATNHDSNVDFMYKNSRGRCQNQLCLNLTGSNSNASAIGAKVRVKATIYGESVWQMQEVSSQTGGGLGSQNDMRIRFGLGDAAQADSVVIEWPSGYQQVLTDTSSTASCLALTEDAGAEVCGYVYHDENNNCIKDEGEAVLSNAKVIVQPGNRLVLTDSTGYYTTRLALGTYDLIHQAGTNWNNSCEDTLSVDVLSMGQQYCDNNFGDTATCVYPDLRLEIESTAQRVGFENLIAVTVSNAGTSRASGVQLSLDLGNDILPVSSTTPWDDVQGTTYKWTFATLDMGERKTIYITDSVATSVTIGSYMDVNGTLNGSELDCNTADNTAARSLLAEGAIDPNDLAVDPEGFVEAGTELTYKIRFQNVGNALVSTVRIEDQLPEGLDPASLEMGVVSHPYQLIVKDDGHITWLFENINLPDSTTAEPESHGFILFKVRIQDDLPDGTILENQVAIYFDQQDPIYTNTVQNIIGERPEYRSLGQLRVLPNPAGAYTNITINKRLTEMVAISLYDLNGQLVYYNHRLNQRQYQLQRGGWPAGTYILKVIGIDGEMYSGKVLFR